MSDTDSVDVLCSKCQVPLVTPDNPESHDIVTCPECGTNDRYDKVINEALRQMIGVVENSFVEAFKDNKNWKITKK